MTTTTTRNKRGYMPAKGARLLNTIRFFANKERIEKSKFNLDFFVEKILQDIFKLKPETVECLQDFSSLGFFDLSFCTEAYYYDFIGKFKNFEAFFVTGIGAMCLHAPAVTDVTVHMYNPFVGEKDIQVFLHRFCSEVEGGGKILNRHGYWCGKRRYKVRFRLDSVGRNMDLPGSFSLGPDRGYLFYPGQPDFCRLCGSFGHLKSACESNGCRHCRSGEHATNNCHAAKLCSHCGVGGHFYRSCPVRRKTFAELFGQGEGPVLVPPGPAAPPAGPADPSSSSLGRVGVPAAGRTGASAPASLPVPAPDSAPALASGPVIVPAPVPAPVSASFPDPAVQVPDPATPPSPPLASALIPAPTPVPVSPPPAAPAPAPVPTKDSSPVRVPSFPSAPPSLSPVVKKGLEDSTAVVKGLAALAASLSRSTPSARVVEEKFGEGDITSPPEGLAPPAAQDQEPVKWADSTASSAADEGMAEWAVASARKRAPSGDMDYPGSYKEPPSIPIANRFQVLADEEVASLDLGMEVESPSELLKSWDGTVLEETMGMVSQELGEQREHSPK